jgi:hypothetical protein
MLTEANRFCLRLWKDESGVVLAVTVVTFLTLFVIACSVFAVGETIRQRIEVQNAADAAAYSAAVVEADALARIASLNKAMGWTYAQQVKMEMDWIVGKWLTMSLIKWAKDYIKVRLRATVSTCALGPFTGWDDYYTGQSHFSNREAMKLNRHDWVDVEEVVDAIKASGYFKLPGKIIKAGINIKAMNKAEAKIIDAMEDKMRRAAKKVIKENIKTSRNDRLSKHRDADIRWAFISNPGKCFKIRSGEHDFLRSVFGRGTSAAELFGTGTDDWFVEKKGKGIGRKYKQNSTTLVAEWSYYGNTWVAEPVPPFCVPTIPTVGSTESRAGQYKDRFYETAICEPQMLKPNYFEKDGAVVIGVARRLHNPFQFLFPHRKIKGIYSLFSVPTGEGDGDHYIWGAAAARAGYRDLGRPDGSYNTTVDSWEQEWDTAVFPPGNTSGLPPWWRMNHGWQGLSPYNLSITDWDACLIPLHRAWAARNPAWHNRGPASGAGAPVSPGRWKGESGRKILDELWTKAEWENIKKPKDKGKGLRKFASDKAPRGMQGKISYGGQMEEHVYH